MPTNERLLMPSDLKGLVEVTSNRTIKMLREAVRPPGRKGTWLRFLSNDRLVEVWHRLRMGNPAHHIAAIAQKDWGIKKDSKIESLSRAIRAFRDKTVGEILADGFDTEERKEMSRQQLERGKRINIKLDGMEELAWLISVQRERLEILLEKEKATIPFKFTDTTVKTLGEQIAKFIEFQIELGLLDAKPPELNLNLRHKFAGLMQHTIQPGGAAVLSATGRFLELLDDNSLTMKLAADGSYELQEDET